MAGARAVDRRHQSPEERARRGDPRPQLPDARDLQRRRRHQGRLAGPGARSAAHPGLGDRPLRRPLHGRDREAPQSREDRAAARPRGRLLARLLDHRRRRARAARPSSRRAGGHLRQHLGRGEGRERRLLHVGERALDRRGAARRPRDLHPRRVPRQLGRGPDHQGGHLLAGPLRGARAVHRARDPRVSQAAPRPGGAGAPRVSARRAGRGRLRRLDLEDEPVGRRPQARAACCSSPSAR